MVRWPALFKLGSFCFYLFAGTLKSLLCIWMKRRTGKILFLSFTSIYLYLMVFVIMVTTICSDDSANSLNKMWTGDTPVSHQCFLSWVRFAFMSCSGAVLCVFVVLWGVSGCATLAVFIWDASFSDISRDMAYFCLCQCHRLCWFQSPILQACRNETWYQNLGKHME